MKKIQEKYSKSQLNYINLDKLNFKVIRRKDDNFYKIVDNTKIRRNYSFTSEEIIKQSTLFDLGEMFLLSKIHIRDSNLMKMKIEISSSLQGPWVSVENDITIVSGKIRVLKIGSLPCRYFRLTVIKGCPIMDFNKIECFGLNINDIKSKYDEDTLDMLYYNSYDLIYRKNNTNYNQSSNNNNNFNSNNNSEYYNSSTGYKNINKNLNKINSDDFSGSENYNNENKLHSNVYNNYNNYNNSNNNTYNYTKSKANTSNNLISSNNSNNYKSSKNNYRGPENQNYEENYDEENYYQNENLNNNNKNQKNYN